MLSLALRVVGCSSCSSRISHPKAPASRLHIFSPPKQLNSARQTNNTVHQCSQLIQIPDHPAKGTEYSDSGMEYKMIGPEHCDQVLEHLRRNFFADEPLNKAAGLCQNGSSCPALEAHCAEAILDRMSVMAVDAREQEQGVCKIVGVVLNGILKPGDTAKALSKLDTNGDADFRKIFDLLHRHNLKYNLFEHFDVACMFDVRILSVDSCYRGQGIANELVKRSVAVARKNGFRLLKADATGIFSQKIFRSHGFEVFSEQPYSKYTDGDGRVILPVEAPHIKMQQLYKAICGAADQDEKEQSR